MMAAVGRRRGDRMQKDKRLAFRKSLKFSDKPGQAEGRALGAYRFAIINANILSSAR
jgi:hypothetical protein